MDAILSYLTSISPTLGAVIVTAGVVWWAGVFYHKMKRTETEVKELKIEVREGAAKMETKMTECATKNDVANLEIKLKENDFYHLGKAMLIGFSLLLKKDNGMEQGFERIKDTILESTPDNRKDEIKSITI
jgi:hypothetical protein